MLNEGERRPGECLGQSDLIAEEVVPVGADVVAGGLVVDDRAPVDPVVFDVVDRTDPEEDPVAPAHEEVGEAGGERVRRGVVHVEGLEAPPRRRWLVELVGDARTIDIDDQPDAVRARMGVGDLRGEAAARRRSRSSAPPTARSPPSWRTRSSVSGRGSETCRPHPARCPSPGSAARTPDLAR